MYRIYSVSRKVCKTDIALFITMACPEVSPRFRLYGFRTFSAENRERVRTTRRMCRETEKNGYADTGRDEATKEVFEFKLGYTQHTVEHNVQRTRAKRRFFKKF